MSSVVTTISIIATPGVAAATAYGTYRLAARAQRRAEDDREQQEADQRASDRIADRAGAVSGFESLTSRLEREIADLRNEVAGLRKALDGAERECRRRVDEVREEFTGRIRTLESERDALRRMVRGGDAP